MRKVNETVEKCVLDSLTGLRAVEQENIILDILKKLYKEKYGLPEDVEIAGVRFGTIDSSFFKRQEGNRDVLKNRKNNVKKAIINQKQVNDIVLNENLEIIDGQARTEALEEINIEKAMDGEAVQVIEFTIKPGLRIADTRNCNTTSNRWVFVDYINSMAGTKSDYTADFNNLNEIIENWSGSFMKTSLISIATGMLSSSGNGSVRKAIKENQVLLFSNRDKKRMDKFLNAICNMLEENPEAVKGIAHKDKLINSMYYLLAEERVSPTRMYNGFKKVNRNNLVTGNFESCLESVVTMYNNGTGKGRKGKDLDFEVVRENFKAFNKKNAEKYKKELEK